MDAIDVRIISELQKNSRISIRELSKIINLSAPSVSERVKRLEDRGVIEGYSIKVNRKKLGFTIECFIMVTMKNGEHEKFKTFITTHPRTEFCYRITGEACYIVKLNAESLDKVEDFINAVSTFGSSRTQVSFSEVPVNGDITKYF